MPALTIMCGLPRSGKSTYAAQLQLDGWVRVCPDDIRYALHGQQFITRAEPYVWATAEIMTRSLLIGGHNVVIDATNVTRPRRALWVNLAREMGIPLRIVWTQADAASCISHNDDKLDVAIIERMAAEFEPPLPDEGEVFEYPTHSLVFPA